MCFWNIAGLGNKCEETMEYLEEFDIVGLVETWMEQGAWERAKKKLGRKFEWRCIPAVREKLRGRARGGIITAVSKELKGAQYRQLGEGAMEIKVKHDNKNWRIITIYSQNIEEVMEKLMDEINEEEEEYLMIGGDFNARTGNEGGPIEEEGKEGEESRRSKDKTINKEGRILLKKIGERGWTILNGIYEEEGGWTYVGERGCSVVDYIVTNEKAMEEVKKVKEGSRTESDHVPLEVELEGKRRRRIRKNDIVKITRSVWTEEGIKAYHGKCEEWECTQTEKEGIWKELKQKVNNAVMKEEWKIIPWKLGRRGWHSTEWKKKKRELRREFRRMNKGKLSREDYIRKRKEFRIWCEKEKERHEKEEEEKIRQIRTEEEAWKYINKYRKKREKIDENIEIDSWKDHFMELMGGTKEGMTGEGREREEEAGEDGERMEEEHEITKEELIKHLRRLKRGKAPGEDGIENEAWRLMPKKIGEVFLELINRIWKEGGIPEEWNRGIISPIYKKGEKENVKNYRGVTLMDTAYKIYANILNERLQGELEGKLGEGQFGFRKGRGTTDAIFIVNYIVNRELAKKKGKIFAFFADLKAAFDKVDRVKLGEMLRKTRISDRLRRRVMETYRETKNRIKVGNKSSEEFWTGKGVRQGCPMSPTLFNVYISDLEEEMRKVQSGGIVVGKEKFWSITYADDIVLLATTETELKGMIKKLKSYLQRKGLILSVEKSKVVVFERGKGRGSKREWEWGRERIEEVKEIKYLGYIVQKNGGTEKHVMERMRRATIAMKMTWSIGERLFKEDYQRRMKMFNALVGSIAMYGAEIWGWRKEERMDRIKRKYMKWVLGLDRGTPNYILAEETKVKELSGEALGRAIRYEEGARRSDKKIVVECMKELEREVRERKESKWERERRTVLERAGMSREELRKRRAKEQPKEIGTEIIRRIEKKEEEVRRKKIEESRYNEEYKKIITEKEPAYLKGRRRKRVRNLIARFRCGNEVRGRHTWRKEEERLCRVCGKDMETWDHVLKECEEFKINMEIEEFLREDGRGWERMNRTEMLRRRGWQRKGEEEMKDEKEQGEGRRKLYWNQRSEGGEEEVD